MIKLKTVFLFLLILPFITKGQELFIRQEPASNIPQNMIGLRFTGEEYREGKEYRTQEALRIMFAPTPRLGLMLTPMVSNHHLASLPKELTSTDDGTLKLHSHDRRLGFPRPYLFAGVNMHAKYLLVKDDGEQYHFRVAVAGEGAYSTQAHDEAEPNLYGDNSGVGAGVVVTQLYKKFAYSITGNYIIPFNYKEKDVVIDYPNSVEYAVSFGYRILPLKYKSYEQLNINAYAEFGGRAFGSAKITKAGEVANLDGAVTLQGNSFLEFQPGLQFIFNSNTRVDVSMGLNIVGRSYSYTYPTYFIQLQHYFFFK